MSRRSSIRLSSTVTPEKPKDDPTILYCNYDNCPLNSLYQCTYCKCYRCIRHARKLDDNTCICIKCITSNNTLYNIKALRRRGESLPRGQRHLYEMRTTGA